tara:strand:+ start:479 stop:712 length:234 start_codon:yes stop_codon:yes gene_type:complete
MLTKRQHELLLFIDGHINKHGYGPSYSDMMKNFGLKSNSGIHRLVIALEERGFISRRPKCARAIEIIRMPPKGNECD